MTNNPIIEKARQGFAQALFAEDYATVHLDDQHLATLLKLCPLVEGKRYLDVGTGNGYVAFGLADQSAGITIIGLDIVTEAIAANNQRTQTEGYAHLDFESYAGLELPFPDAHIFGLISRYAFHHFPDPALSVAEFGRILKPDGFVLIADPIPHRRDEVDFINRFMALKDDGHVRFHSGEALAALFAEVGLQVEDQITTSITFPRPGNEHYRRLIDKTPADIIEAYNVQFDHAQVFATVEVLNTRFRRG